MAKCYNGCWDSETQAQLGREDAMLRKLREIEPQAHCTLRYPERGRGTGGGGYQLHVWGQPLSGIRGSREAALQEAIDTARQKRERAEYLHTQDLSYIPEHRP